MFPNQTAALMHSSNADFIHDYRAQLQKSADVDPTKAPKPIGSFAKETQGLGQEVHTRKPGTAPYPRGKVPVHLVGVDANARNKITSLSHGYVVAGNPGKGKDTHPTYFSRSSDEKRGIMNIDKQFAERAAQLKKKGTDEPLFSKDALAALEKVEAKTYTSKEAFFLAYAGECKAQGRDVTLDTVIKEYTQMVFMATENEMEVWMREPNGPDAGDKNAWLEQVGNKIIGPHDPNVETKEAWLKRAEQIPPTERAALLEQLSPLAGNKLSSEDRALRNALISGMPLPKANMAERDVRVFMDPFGKDSAAREEFNSMSEADKLSGNAMPAGSMAFRHIPGADILNMIEVTRQERLERSFGDEVHNRNGTLLPASMFGRPDITVGMKIKDVPLAELQAYSETTQNDPSTKSDFAKSQVDSRGERVQISPAKSGMSMDKRTETMAARKQIYEFAPEEGKEQGINCNTGAKSILTDAGLAESDVKPATPFQVALHGETRSWNPLSKHPEVSANLPKNGTPQSRLDNMQRSANVLNAKLPQFARTHAERIQRMDQSIIAGEGILATRQAAATRATLATRPATARSSILRDTDEVIRKAEEDIAQLKARNGIGESSPSLKAEADAAVQRLLADPDLTVAQVLQERQWEGSSDSDHHQ